MVVLYRYISSSDQNSYDPWTSQKNFVLLTSMMRLDSALLAANESMMSRSRSRLSRLICGSVATCRGQRLNVKDQPTTLYLGKMLASIALHILK